MILLYLSYYQTYRSTFVKHFLQNHSYLIMITNNFIRRMVTKYLFMLFFMLKVFISGNKKDIFLKTCGSMQKAGIRLHPIKNDKLCQDLRDLNSWLHFDNIWYGFEETNSREIGAFEL